MSRTTVWIIIILFTAFFVVEFGYGADVNCEEKQEECGGYLKEDMEICDVISEASDKLTCQYYTIRYYEKCLGECPEPTDANGCTGDTILDFEKTQCGE